MKSSKKPETSLVPKTELGPTTDLRQSPGWAKFMASLGWSVDRIGETVLLRRSLPILGTIIRVQRPNVPLPLEEINKLSRTVGAFLVKIEPNLLADGFDLQVMGGFRKDTNPMLPRRSIWIDLSLTEETLIANFDKDARNLTRRAEKDAVAVVESREIKSFYDLWRANAKQKHFYVPFAKELDRLWKELPEKHLLVAKHHGQIVAAVLLLGYKGVLYYSFAASSDAGRAVHAPYLLMWEVIKRGKRWGYKRLDLEGVGGKKSWLGFSQFKRQFGGKEVEFVGSFSKAYNLWGFVLGRFV